MNYFKKTIILTAIITTLVIMVSCSQDSGDTNEKISIVTTGFPEYDWTRELLANVPEDEYELTMLLSDGTDMHSYQPSAQDIVDISEADMFVYGGGESDAWVEEVLEEAGNESMQTVNLMQISEDNALEEEVVEGMQEGREAGGDDDEAEEPEYDEHVWMSPRNAILCCRDIAQKLVVLLPEYEDTILDARAAYTESLEALYEEFGNAVGTDQKTIICCGRFPFRYLMDEYGIDYYAAFPGCSTEANASFETILFLAGKVDELGADYVIVPDNDEEELAETVIETTAGKNAEVVRMYSMQNVTLEEAESGTTYISLMDENVKTLAKVLGN